MRVTVMVAACACLLVGAALAVGAGSAPRPPSNFQMMGANRYDLTTGRAWSVEFDIRGNGYQLKPIKESGQTPPTGSYQFYSPPTNGTTPTPIYRLNTATGQLWVINPLKAAEGWKDVADTSLRLP